MIQVSGMHAYYGKSHILQGVDMNVQEGEIVALLGRNGVGRSTTCKAIMGEVEPHGSVMFKGQELAGKKAFEIANIGLGYVPPAAADLGSAIEIEVRGRALPARIVATPFVKASKGSAT